MRIGSGKKGISSIRKTDWWRCKGLVVDFCMFLPWTWIHWCAPPSLASSLLHFSFLSHLFRLNRVPFLLLSPPFPHHLLLVWNTRNTPLRKAASSWHAPPKSGINREYYSSPGPHKILNKDMGSSNPLCKEPVSGAAAKNYVCQHFQGDNNPPDDQSSTLGRGQGTNLGEKLMTSLLLPPVQVMFVVRTTLLHSGCL